VQFLKTTTPDSDGLIAVKFNSDFCTQLCQHIRALVEEGGPTPPVIAKCFAACDKHMLTLEVEEPALELQVQSRPVASEIQLHIVADPRAWAVEGNDDIPGHQEFTISGYAGLELSAKLDGLQPGSAHEFRTRACRPQGAWGLWSDPVVYETLTRTQDNNRDYTMISSSPKRSPSPLFVGGSPPSPEQLVDREAPALEDHTWQITGTPAGSEPFSP